MKTIINKLLRIKKRIQQKRNILIAEKNGIREEQRHQMKEIEENVKRCWKRSKKRNKS